MVPLIPTLNHTIPKPVEQLDRPSAVREGLNPGLIPYHRIIPTTKKDQKLQTIHPVTIP